MSYIDDLDMCASLGIINFDGPAFIKGTAPRFVGNPAFETIPDFSPAMRPQPQKDEFKQKKKRDIGKIIGYGLIAAALIMGISRIKSFKMPKIKMPSFSGIKKIPAKIGAFAKNVWGKITGLFKKKP